MTPTADGHAAIQRRRVQDIGERANLPDYCFLPADALSAESPTDTERSYHV